MIDVRQYEVYIYFQLYWLSRFTDITKIQAELAVPTVETVIVDDDLFAGAPPL